MKWSVEMEWKVVLNKRNTTAYGREQGEGRLGVSEGAAVYPRTREQAMVWHYGFSKKEADRGGQKAVETVRRHSVYVCM